MRAALSLDEYRAMVGTEVGVSEWITVDQAKIDAFADATGDHQFIHVDPEAAAATPFGSTIAHGYLTLSLCTAFAYGVMPEVVGARFGVNYGFNRIRFMAPVKSGSQVRGRFALTGVEQRGDGAYQSTVAVTVEIDGEPKPALAAEWLTLVYL